MKLHGTAQVSPAKISRNRFPFDFAWIPVVAHADTFYCFQMFGEPHESSAALCGAVILKKQDFIINVFCFTLGRSPRGPDAAG